MHLSLSCPGKIEFRQKTCQNKKADEKRKGPTNDCVRNQMSKPVALNVHTLRFSTEEVVINSDVFTWVRAGDVLAIYPADRPETDRLAIRVTTQGVTKSKHGRATLQVSLSKGIADRFGLLPMQDVIVERVDPLKIGLDALQLTFDSQYLSRSVLWRISLALDGTCLSRGKSINILGHKLRVQNMFINGAEVTSGLVQSFTKVNFRSRSARILWMVQLSKEMWDFANDGDIFFEKAMKTFFQPCFERWQNMKAKHCLTVIYYTRTIFHEHSAASRHRPKLRASVCKDSSSGVHYEDVFHTVLENETKSSNWCDLISRLKQAFMEFPALANWTLRPDKEILRRQRSASPFGHPSTQALPATITGGCPAPAAQGNFFEALNLALNIFDLHHMDRDLTRTGQGVVLISPGIGLFEIDRELLLLTKRRLLDSGVGIDLLCLNSRPLHQVPLLIYKQDAGAEEKEEGGVVGPTNSEIQAATASVASSISSTSSTSSSSKSISPTSPSADSNQMYFNVPHWLRISFPAQPAPISDNFSPLPTHRMVDLLPGKEDDGMEEGDVWWGSDVVKNRVPPTLQTILKSMSMNNDDDDDDDDDDGNTRDSSRSSGSSGSSGSSSTTAGAAGAAALPPPAPLLPLPPPLLPPPPPLTAPAPLPPADTRKHLHHLLSIRNFFALH